MSSTVAIWVLVVIAAVVGYFLARFLNQLTRVGAESETALKTINKRLPPLLDNAEKTLAKADVAVNRANATLDELEGPIHYVRMFTHLLTESRKYLHSKAGRGMMAAAAGFKAVKAIISGLKHRSSGSDDATE